jgi:hypothetical protein
MLYDVTYQLDGKEHTDRIEADDAPTAAALARRAHERTDQRYELLLVHLIEPEADDALCATAASEPTAGASS